MFGPHAFAHRKVCVAGIVRSYGAVPLGPPEEGRVVIVEASFEHVI
jgi:hypothetical protein